MTALLCLCACPDEANARRIADALVQARLAACVNLVPGMRSVYRWQDAVVSADEVLLLVKTTQAREPALREAIAALHPYDVPELLALRVDGGLPAYLDWLAAQCAPAAA